MPQTGDRRVLEGKVEFNPFGNWSDVDHGVYVGGERVGDEHYGGIWDGYEGKRVRVTIEVLPDPPEGDPEGG